MTYSTTIRSQLGKFFTVSVIFYVAFISAATKSFSAENSVVLDFFSVGDCVEYWKSDSTFDFVIYKNSSKTCVISYEYTLSILDYPTIPEKDWIWKKDTCSRKKLQKFPKIL